MVATQYKKAKNPYEDYEAVNIKCPRCQYKWKFAGKKLKHLDIYPVYAQCPNCRTSIKVPKSKKEEGVKSKS